MAYTEFYTQTTGSNLNAGSTNTDAATQTYASGNWVAGTGVFTVASGDPAGDGVTVGDWASVYPDGSSVAVFIGRVTARDTTTITVSLTAKSGTAPTDGTGNRTVKIGGAWKGPNAAVGFPFNFADTAMVNASGDYYRINMLAQTYSVTAAMTHTLAGPGTFEGYTTTPGDGGRATIDGGTGGAGYVLFNISGANLSFENLEFANNGSSGSSTLVSISGLETTFRQCVFHDSRGSTFLASSTGLSLISCEGYASNKSGTAGGTCFFISGRGVLYNCIAHDCPSANTSGFTLSGATVTLVNCISDSNSSDGYILSTVASAALINCDSYNNGGDGIDMTVNTGALFDIINCNLVNNSGWGINSSGSTIRSGSIQNCGFGAGTVANSSGTIATSCAAMVQNGTVIYEPNLLPWVDAPNGDFRINIAAAKGAGNGLFLQTSASYSGTVGYSDIGAAQSLREIIVNRLMSLSRILFS